MNLEELEPIIEAALREDMPRGDITSENIIPPDSVSEAVILAKQAGVLAGLGVARRVFEKVNPAIGFLPLFEDGQPFCKGDILAEVKGNSVALLKGERTALNFLQRMSGIATTTQEYVQAARGTKAKILDTRKTTPGLRAIEKYAVRMGGGENHRLNLSEMVLIKDNHLDIAAKRWPKDDPIKRAMKAAKAKASGSMLIEVEVVNLDQVKSAIEAGGDMILLDNMTLDQMTKAVKLVKASSRKILTEASGGVKLDTVRQIAQTGVDRISIGALTHSARALDIALEM